MKRPELNPLSESADARYPQPRTMFHPWALRWPRSIPQQTRINRKERMARRAGRHTSAVPPDQA